jgi:hypothetical protein
MYLRWTFGYARRVAGHLGVGEGPAHLTDPVSDRFARQPPFLDEVAPELLQNLGRPERAVVPGFCQPQQLVVQVRGEDRTRVEERGEPDNTLARSPSTGWRPGGGLVQAGFLPFARHPVQGFPALAAHPLLIGKKVGEQDAAMPTALFIRDLAIL